MTREQSGPFLSAVFVDYDNIYLSLRRKSEDAAKRFAKEAPVWLKQIEAGALITPTNGIQPAGQRRIVMNRCYGNPVPRRNTSDNSTDMSSFPFVRHHFLRAGFEVVDCPPLTAQLKNSSDIRMVMDLRDFLGHETHFDEFIILSGDADFTPVLHRLRAHARRTVIYATDYTAAPYTAISDGEVREADLIALLVDGRIEAEPAPAEIEAQPAPNLEAIRRSIIDEIVQAVRTAHAPVPLEVLADRAVRSIGHERTIGTAWGGTGGFREFLAQNLPAGFRLSGEPPYVVIDTQRHLLPAATQRPLQSQPVTAAFEIAEPRFDRHAQPAAHDIASDPRALAGFGMLRSQASHEPERAPVQAAHAAAVPQVRRPLTEPASPVALKPEATSPGQSIQQSIARIHEACKAPPLAPPEYRLLFELIAQEI
ncbi:MAG: NYN domain-containing protein, partial [Proteobacteria bacterium]|nr:NYN domain-containing protein [Pseudomonadota bacterium]